MSGGVGLVDEIPKLSISDGELRFALEGHFRRDRNLEKGLFWARFEDSKLKGTFEIEGDPSSYLEWTGVRAPVLSDKDDGSWKRGDPVMLFDGHDLAGWLPLPAGRAPAWTVRDGILTGQTGAPDLVSEKKFWNFSLDAEIDWHLAPTAASACAAATKYKLPTISIALRPIAGAAQSWAASLLPQIWPDSMGNGKPLRFGW